MGHKVDQHSYNTPSGFNRLDGFDTMRGEKKDGRKERGKKEVA